MARAIVLVASLVFLVIALGIVLVVLGANPQNAVVQLVTAAARFLVGPFDGLFTLRDPQLATAVNWGTAAFLWLTVGLLLAGLLRRIGPSARRGKK